MFYTYILKRFLKYISGDPQGCMTVSPAGFGYMTGRLAELGIPLCLLLEGGYFIESVAKGALFSMQALLNRVKSCDGNFKS